LTQVGETCDPKGHEWQVKIGLTRTFTGCSVSPRTSQTQSSRRSTANLRANTTPTPTPPDSNPGDPAAEAKFKEISEANSVLSDPVQRKEYDQIRAMGSGARFTAPGSGGASGGFEDVFGPVFGGGAGRQGFPQGGAYDDLLSSLFAQQGGRSSGSTRGRDVSASTTLDFLTAVKG